MNETLEAQTARTKISITVTSLTVEEWHTEGMALFGPDQMQWRFVCPVCGFVQSTQNYKDAGAPSAVVAYSCVGRYIAGSRDAFGAEGPGPCNYAGGGLFRLNPVSVEGRRVFAFAGTEVKE